MFLTALENPGLFCPGSAVDVVIIDELEVGGLCGYTLSAEN